MSTKNADSAQKGRDYSNSTTCVQWVRNAFSAPCFLVICAAATMGSQRWTYCMAMSFFLQKSFKYKSAFF